MILEQILYPIFWKFNSSDSRQVLLKILSEKEQKLGGIMNMVKWKGENHQNKNGNFPILHQLYSPPSTISQAVKFFTTRASEISYQKEAKHYQEPIDNKSKHRENTFQMPSVLSNQDKFKVGGGDGFSNWASEELANLSFFDHNQILEME